MTTSDTPHTGSTSNANTLKIREIYCGIIWFLFLSAIFCFNFIIVYFNLFDYIIINNTSSILSLLIFILFPVILLFSPFFISLVWKKPLSKSVSISVIIVVLYFIVILGLNVYLIIYFQTFTKNKWAQFPDNRFLMIENLESQYTLTGMSKEEVLSLLGEPGILGRKTTKELEYFIKSKSSLEYEVYIVAFQDNIATKHWRETHD